MQVAHSPAGHALQTFQANELLSLLVHGAAFHSFADHAKHNCKQDTRDPHSHGKDPRPTNRFQKLREGGNALGENVPGFAIVPTANGGTSWALLG